MPGMYAQVKFTARPADAVCGLTGQERLVVSPPDGLTEGARVAAREAG